MLFDSQGLPLNGHFLLRRLLMPRMEIAL